MPKPIEATIRLTPNRYKLQYSKIPKTKKKPPMSAVKDVNHDADTVRNLGIPESIN